jgi:putative membrane protein
MVQHLALLTIVPLLLLVSQPFLTFAALCGKARTASFVRATRGLHALSHPVFTLLFFLAVLWGTHFSSLYEASLRHPAIHLMEHALYVAAGFAFWLPVVAPAPLRPLPFPSRLLYLLVALPQGALLAVAIGGARAPLYPSYVDAEGVARAMADQSNAAAVMWIGGGLAAFAAFLSTFAVWAARESRAPAP